MNAEQDLYEQHEQLREALATRQSTYFFAHAGVSFIVALILSGATGKLFWDSVRTPYLAWLLAAVTLGLLVYAVSSYRKARVFLVDELARYETLLELRRRLRLDDPAALLPR